jgi:hypothetical protein
VQKRLQSEEFVTNLASSADNSPSKLVKASSKADDSQSDSDNENDSSIVVCDLNEDAISNRIETLVQKRLQSHADDKFLTDLEQAERRSYLRACDLDVLIQSRGTEPNALDNRKMKLEAWMAVKDAPMAWERTARWTMCDEEDLLQLQTSLE